MKTSVLIKTESHYIADRKKLRRKAEEVLKNKGVRSDVEVSISIVGDRLMKNLNHKFRKINETTDVLSFPLNDDIDTAFGQDPDGVLRLGDVVISYPQAVEEARLENKLIDDKIDELLEHGMLHLLGQHHD